jgi:hypothetical protein
MNRITVLITVCVLLVASVWHGTARADQKADVEQFFSDIALVNKEYQAKFFLKQRMILQANAQGDLDFVREKSLEMIDELKKAIQALEKVPTPKECLTYKQINVDIFKKMLQMARFNKEALSAQTQAQKERIMEDVKKAGKEMSALFAQNTVEYRRILNKFSIVDRQW